MSVRKEIIIDGHPITLHFAQEEDNEILSRIKKLLLENYRIPVDFGEGLCDNVVAKSPNLDNRRKLNPSTCADGKKGTGA